MSPGACLQAAYGPYVSTEVSLDVQHSRWVLRHPAPGRLTHYLAAVPFSCVASHACIPQELLSDVALHG